MNITESNFPIELAPEDQQVEELLASIVEMIKQREKLALETSFARIICRLTDAKGLTFYRLIATNNETSVIPILQFIGSEIVPHKKLGTKPFSLSSNPQLADQLSKSSVADMFQGTAKREKNLVLPLKGANGEVSVFCQVENAINDDNTKRVLSLLLDFHRHFLSLLDDNERDNLTGLLNRKTLTTQIIKIIRTLQNKHRRTSDKSSEGFCLAVFDIDHFKQVNDSFGHIYGDDVLLLFANLMKDSFRENDQLFRYGGEEFVALLADVGTHQAKIVLDRFRTKVKNYQFPQVGHITASIGVASIREDESPAEATHRADLALYFAKEHGRNQVRAYEELVAQGLLTEQKLHDSDVKLH